MESKLLLLTGIVALAFVGPFNASAATITIRDLSDASPPMGTVDGFLSARFRSRSETSEHFGGFFLIGSYRANNPVPPNETFMLNFNMNDPGDDGQECCSDTLHIRWTGIQPASPMDANVSVRVAFTSAFEGNRVAPLKDGFMVGGGPFPETIEVPGFGLTVTAMSDVPGPIVGAGLPGLIAACGALLILARRRRQLIV
jgi:hypothetical protein